MLNRVKSKSGAAAVLCTLSMMGCDDNPEKDKPSTDKPSLERADVAVTRFKSSGCKQQLGTADTKGTGEKVPCVDWNRDGDKLTLSLRDFSEGCGFPEGDGEDLWQAKATSPDDEELKLDVFWDFESANACGACTYDWELEVDLTDVSEPTTLTIATRACTGNPCSPETYDFVLGSAAKGTVCEGE